MTSSSCFIIGAYPFDRLETMSVQTAGETRFVVDCKVNPVALVGHLKITLALEGVIVICGGLSDPIFVHLRYFRIGRPRFYDVLANHARPNETPMQRYED